MFRKFEKITIRWIASVCTLSGLESKVFALVQTWSLKNMRSNCMLSLVASLPSLGTLVFPNESNFEPFDLSPHEIHCHQLKILRRLSAELRSHRYVFGPSSSSLRFPKQLSVSKLTQSPYSKCTMG